MIQRFKINKLFGFRNVTIPFENNIKILIGENGLGKTTILNSLYYVLSEKYNKLFAVDFERIELLFNDGFKFQFTRRELEIFIRFQDRRERRQMPREILNMINLSELETYFKTENDDDSSEKAFNKYIIEKKIPRWAPIHIMARELRFLFHDPAIQKFIQFGEYIRNYPVEILYFPTYRRVEEDLKNLGRFRRRIKHAAYDDDLFEEIEEDFQVSDDTLIHFGMEDVENRIDRVKELINISTVDGFSKVTGEILSQLLKGFPEIEKQQVDNLDIPTAKIVLHRVADSLSYSDRNEILNLLDKPQNLLKKKELTYFLFNLIEIYNKHKHVDDGIKKFRDVCNNYLEDKEFRYNESTVDIAVYRKGTDEVVLLNKLSSGEKQIISLFSKIYLEFTNSYLVLFDEPELSLSIEWQKQLLPDIINSGKCSFLLSVTHSPFIFKNELDKFAIGMNTFIK